VEFNSTFVSLTTIANISDKDVLFDNNTNASTLIDDVATFMNSTLLSTSVSLETTYVSVSESNTTFNETTDLPTILTTKISTEKNEEETTTMSITSCELSKYGCCTDGVTERTGKSLKKDRFFLVYVYYHYLGPNNEGCNEDDMNITISNSTVEFMDETDYVSTIENENITMITEKSDAFLETSTENITSIASENNSTQFDIDNTTTTFVVDNTTEEVFVSSSTESIETTTQTDTTVKQSTLCVDSEFECCPDGETPAQVIEILL